MEWYERLPKKLASKPPAYVIERISDIRHAFDLSKTSPSTSRSILNGIISQLSEHLDNEYVDALKQASTVVVDNPVRARGLMLSVQDAMVQDKEDHDYNMRTPSWQTN